MKCTSVELKIFPFITYFWLKRILGVIKDTLTYILTGKGPVINNLRVGPEDIVMGHDTFCSKIVGLQHKIP